MLDQHEAWKSRLSVPAYRIGEAATYAGVSPQTVSSWERENRKRRAALGARRSEKHFSFLELIEIAIVAELRKQGVKLADIGAARQYFVSSLGSDHPFATERFKADGVDILLDMPDSDGEDFKDRLLVANRNGQYIWADFLQKKFENFNYDSHGDVVRWYVSGRDSPVVIDPRISYGSPSVGGVMGVVAQLTPEA